MRIAELLAGSWRGLTRTSAASELERLTPLLLKAGAGGLVWSAIRNSPQRDSGVAELFKAAYRLQSLQSKLHERSLKKVIPALRAAGVEPLLVKGWAIARMYPEPGLRPYLDLDLCVRPNDYVRADEVLRGGECDDCVVDLHSGFGKFYDRRTEEVFARSKLVDLEGVAVRVLGAEDDLRFLCLHLLRHGAMQPLWLCDICVSLEARANDFDWDRCLSGSKKEADWVACAIGVAHQLMGADVEGTPVAQRARELPGWLLPAVIDRWGSSSPLRVQLAPLLSDRTRILRELIRELPHHWPNPIEASMALGASFNRAPRFPFQVGHLLSRSASMLVSMLRPQSGGIQQKV